MVAQAKWVKKWTKTLRANSLHNHNGYAGETLLPEGKAELANCGTLAHISFGAHMRSYTLSKCIKIPLNHQLRCLLQFGPCSWSKVHHCAASVAFP